MPYFFIFFISLKILFLLQTELPSKRISTLIFSKSRHSWILSRASDSERVGSWGIFLIRIFSASWICFFEPYRATLFCQFLIFVSFFSAPVFSVVFLYRRGKVEVWKDKEMGGYDCPLPCLRNCTQSIWA